MSKIEKLFFLQKEERERIRLFRYRQDAKASIVGRLLMRYWAKITLPNLTNAQLHFERSERGRPMLKSLLPNWDFNVSHAGKFTVFVAEGLLQHQISVFQFTFF